MEYIKRALESKLRRTLERRKSILLLGARQTGKTTLVSRLSADLTLSFVAPDVRLRYEKDPSLLTGEVEALQTKTKGKNPLIILDEVQKVPEIMDVVQDLIDRKKGIFVLTGSSARKLKRGQKINLLPGRVAALRLEPFILNEFSSGSLKEKILYGSLPGIVSVEKAEDRELDLASYVTTYLEEEVRAEALVRNLGSFARFLEYAASESGLIIHLRNLSQQIGVSHTTIASYFEILEDCLICERIEPLTASKTRKKLTQSHKYLFFDMGVRRAAAREGTNLPREAFGRLFEQWVGLELIRCAQLCDRHVRIRFWRDPDGPEVDWLIDREGEYIPIEVKWTETPSRNDAKHLEVFLSEYTSAKAGYVVCQTPRKAKLSNRVFALPWQDLDALLLD